ncbi:MAG: PHB depolymerase family esterase [Bacteroidota bacterium]
MVSSTRAVFVFFTASRNAYLTPFVFNKLSLSMKSFPFLLGLILSYTGLFAQVFVNESFSHDNRLREYIVYIPANFDSTSPMPLLLNFHGYTSNALEQIYYGDFQPIADTAGFLIVAPQGTRDFSSTTHWNVGWGGSAVDDVSFANALIDSMIAQYNVDPNRVYSTGMSNGGFMSHQLACELSDRIAAIASVTGSMTYAKLNACDPQHPTPVMQIHGTADLVVPYGGQSPWTAPVDSVVAYWAAYNQCQLPPLETDLQDINTGDGSTVRHYQYLNGSNAAQVELYKIFNGGHTWPNNQFVSAGTNYDFDASLVIWQFFAQYDLEGLRTNTSLDAGTPQTNFELYPNPAASEMSVLRSSNSPTNYQISDLNGKILQEGEVRAQLNISLQDLPAGIYVLAIDGAYKRFAKQ